MQTVRIRKLQVERKMPLLRRVEYFGGGRYRGNAAKIGKGFNVCKAC